MAEPGGLSAAIQGELGAFSHEAALRALGPDVRVLPQPTFDALFAAVCGGAAARGVVPVENTLVGSIHENYDRLKANPLHIVAETQVRVRLCLVARPGTPRDAIRRVASHPVALGQCRRFFAAHPELEAVPAYDTAGSVRDLFAPGAAADAAIGSALAARLYGGVVLEEAIEDFPENYTRFLVVAREPAVPRGASKTSLVFTLPNVPGSLYRAMGVFAARGLDLTKIESRPLPGRPWEYAFYLDVLGDPRGALGEALEECRAMASEFRVLGSYPRGAGEAEPPA
jgi:prephenate dehydratase